MSRKMFLYVRFWKYWTRVREQSPNGTEDAKVISSETTAEALSFTRQIRRRGLRQPAEDVTFKV